MFYCVGYLFHFLNGVFESRNVIILMKFSLSAFSFVAYAFGITFEKSLRFFVVKIYSYVFF